MNPDLDKMTVTELKALAFDVIQIINQQNRNLQIIDAKLAEKMRCDVPSVPSSPPAPTE